VRLPSALDPQVYYDNNSAIAPSFTEGFYILLSGFAANVTAI